MSSEEETNLKNSIEKIVTDDRKARKDSLEKAEQNVEQNVENEIKAPDNAIVKEQISIPGLKEEPKNIELSAKIPEDQVITKENTAKI